MSQRHSYEDDEAVIRDLIRYMRHPNYIRIDGRPLLLVYRVALFPDFVRTAEHWRATCRREGLGEIYLAFVESFDMIVKGTHPSEYGCDATVEFPPHGMGDPQPMNVNRLNPDYQGVVNDYREVAVRFCHRPPASHVRFRGLMPGWDNTARRQNHSYSFEHSTPGAFEAWAENIIEETRATRSGEERIVFVNAWNEWAECAYLEPDRRFGHTYLEALKNAKDSSLLKRRDRYALG
jgi:lipopolysaccharide biosynthesis protein